MPIDITRDQLRVLRDHDAQLVEVLPRTEYNAEHIAGATSIPLQELDERVRELDRERPVVVYCWDSACDLSPRAAHRLESLGFDDVYDYVEGKLDWMAAGLEIEGDRPEPRAGELAHPIPTCSATAKMGDLLKRSDIGSDGVCVVDADGVVLGYVRGRDLKGDPSKTAEDVMVEGPPTYRPFVPASEMRDEMRNRKRDEVLVTTSDGHLVGVLTRRDLTRH